MILLYICIDKKNFFIDILFFLINQYVLSPVKPTQKVTYGPVTYSRSPRRIAPATNATISTLNTGGKLAALVCPTSVTSTVSSVKMPISQSPTKVILKSVPQVSNVKNLTFVFLDCINSFE